MRIPCNCPAKLCPDQSEGILECVAVSVELSSFEVVLGGSEEKLQAFRIVEGLVNELHVSVYCSFHL